MNAVVSADLATHEDRLEFNQRLRHRMVDSLLQTADAEGKPMPSSDEDRKFLMELLRDSDRTGLAAMKINSEDVNASKDRLLAQTLHALGQKIGNTDVYKRDPIEGEVVSRHVIPEGILPEFEPVPGEMDMVQETATYKDLENKFGRAKLKEAVPGLTDEEASLG